MKRIYLFLALVCFISLRAQPPGWLYNQPFTVTNPNATNAVLYQLKITVNTQSMIAAGQMLANGNDIRFGATCTGTNFLNYWIEGGLNTPTTTIWVKLPLVAANTSSVFYMYYGNSGAAAASTIPGTFRGPNSATDSVSGGTSGGLILCQRGFRFSPNQNILVTHFGKNEPSGTMRYVTLFNYTNQAILSQTQVAGPAATYSYGPIPTPLWLTSGTQYVLQIFGLATDGYFYQTSSQIGQHLTYYDMQYSNGGNQNTFPNSVLANYHYGYGDFWYFIASTMVISPTYTFGGSSVTITASSPSLCSGGSATLSTNATGSFTWNTGSTNTAIVVNPGVTTTYSVAATNSTGCNSNAFQTVTVNTGAPTLTITATAQTVCPTNSVILTASGALSYSWTNGVTNGVPFYPLNTATYIVSGANGCGTSTALTTITVTALPVIAIASPTIVCAGSNSTLTAAGATTYSWSPGNLSGTNVYVSPQANTVYTVIGTTGVCAGIFTLSLPVNPVPTISAASSTMMTCAGDQVTLSATGAQNYTWTPGPILGGTVVVAPLVPTGYFVTGSNNFGCTSVVQVPVIALPGPTVVAQATPNQICVGASATLSATGANSYTWIPGGPGNSQVVNPTSNTTYTVIGTSTANTCSDTKTLTLVVFVATISVTQPTAVCLGGSVNLVASGATNYTWSTGTQANMINVTPVITTTYFVNGQGTLNGMVCESTATTMVTVNPLPTVTAVSTRSIICKNETAIIQASGAANYLWSTTATTSTIGVSPSTNTTYTVTGTDANNCVATATIQIKVSTCQGIGELTSSGKVLQVFPNPNKGEFTIKGAEALDAVLVNAVGQLVYTIRLTIENNFETRISGLAKGVYFVQSLDKHKELNLKVMVND